MNGGKNMLPLDGKRVLITGGTGSLGQVLVRRLLTGEIGVPSKVIVFSRDEAKQHFMRIEYQNKATATDEIIYRNSQQLLEFRIGDIRNYHSIASVLRDVDIVFNAAALKQVPTCEYFPYEAVMTNILGPENIVTAIWEHNLDIETVVGVSTDKACKPVNVMGMTKAIQERVFIQGNMRCHGTRFICVRYGNVLASRGSVVPLFHDQIRNGGPVTITTVEMTRFLLSLDEAVNTIFAALNTANPGETYIPKPPSVRIIDLAKVLIGDRDIKTQITGIRPGEKIHEVLVSLEEAYRTIDRDKYFVLQPMLPELLKNDTDEPKLGEAFNSASSQISLEQIEVMLRNKRLMYEDVVDSTNETLR